MSRSLLTLIACAFALCCGAREPIEGEWRVNGGGPILLFKASESDAGRIDIVWVDGDEDNVSPGTVVGYAVASPRAGVYDCTGIDPRSDKGRKGADARNTEFVAKLDSDHGDTLEFDTYERSRTVDVRRLLPWWLRLRIKNKDTRPHGLDGARRTDAPPAFVVL